MTVQIHFQCERCSITDVVPMNKVDQAVAELVRKATKIVPVGGVIGGRSR